MRFSLVRKYWKTAELEVTGHMGDDPMFFVQYVFRFLRVVVLLSVWRAIFEKQPQTTEMGLAAILTYTLIAEIFHEQLNPQTGLAWDVLRGRTATAFLQPISLVEQFCSKMVGRWLSSVTLFSVPLFLFSSLLGVNVAPASPIALLLFLVSLGLCVSIGVALDFIITALGMIYFEQTIYAVERVRTALTLLLSGALIPLTLMPWGLGDILQWLPFASTASAPLQIYIGAGNPLFLLMLQFGWALVLWPLSYWLWESNREKLVSFGG